MVEPALLSDATPSLPGSRRAEQWASTMAGHLTRDTLVRHAHADGFREVTPRPTADRGAREQLERLTQAEGSTFSDGAGIRAHPEKPDPLRTCFERDRDRILHGTTAFRRLAGKTQVFIFPEDHQRTRLTHALEVAQVASAIARATGLNVALTEAIALGHDCGHGPGGHASEDAFGPFVPGGYDHAVWGADVVLEPLNLCVETLDGVRNHSWSRPTPMTPEGEAVSWADRIAYVCHDFEDAVHAGIVTPADLPDAVRERCGSTRAEQLGSLIGAMIATITATGHIAMDEAMAEALAAFRRFNYERIYMRPASVAQSESVIRVLRALVEYYADRPNTLPLEDPHHRPAHQPALVRPHAAAGTPEALLDAVTYVAGMTDRFAFNAAVSLLGWDRSTLPQGVGVR
ncbi:MAG TPA: HD domain-containing protein [Microthrixaceae bacterium]|nr:HD domain-containing protein [Microthrixaceae bacterium]